MKKLLLSVVITLVSSMGYSQLTGVDGSTGGSTASSGKFLPEVVPPSPEAAALSRFTEVPVSHYTGMANVSIPIHTISLKGIQIPISLSYHGRGVKVSEIAPRTGMGWSLTYGGDISRQIRGRADDVTESGKFNYFSERGTFENYSSNKSSREIQGTREIHDPGYDFYPDQFTFSGGGSSGKFVFDYKDLKPVIQSYGDVKITCIWENGSSGKIIGFTMKDPSGNTFYYGVSKDGQRKEIRESQTSIGISVYNNGNQIRDEEGSTLAPYTSWKLMDIETPYGEIISYHYTERTSVGRFEKAHDKHNSESLFTNSLRNMSDLTKISTKFSQIDATEYQLSKITYNQGSIVFTPETTGREDYNGYALDKITIYDKDNNKIKAFDLNYMYTRSTDQTNLLPYVSQNTSLFGKSFNRLFLTSIEEEGKDNTTLPPYEFTYNSTVLPSRFSTRQDYWGYYNGAIDNGPFLRMFNYGTYKPDRRVHLENSKAGLLEQIKYPTGGITKFSYDHNRGFLPSQIIKNLILPKINPQSVSEITVVFNKSDFVDFETGEYKRLSLDIASDLFSYSFGCQHLEQEGSNPEIPDCIFQLDIGGSPISPGSTGQIYIQNEKVNLGISNIRHPLVPIDWYTNDLYDFKLYITYQPNERMIYAGGKRIQRIEYISEKNTKIKEFEYQDGSIHGLPGFISRGGEYDYDYDSDSGIMTETIDMFHYFDQTSAYSSFQGNSIGYSYVTEYNGTVDDNEGKTDYSFTNFSDSGGDYYEFPYHPPTDNEWLRGKNIKTRVIGYDQESKTYVLKREIYNKYQYADNVYSQDFDRIALFDESFVVEPGTLDDWKNFVFTPKSQEYHWNNSVASDYTRDSKIFKLPLFMKKASYSMDSADWGYRIYHLTGGVVNLNSSIQRDYFNGKVLETKTNYFYDYPTNYQLKRSEMTDSKGDVYKTVNDYYLLLNRENRMQPVTTTSFKNDIELSSQHSVYETDVVSGILLPKAIQTSKGSQDLEDRAIFHSYDSSGNPVEVSKKDGTKIYYVWGYNQTQPIAKIEGYSSISSEREDLIRTVQSASNNDEDEATENILRSKLSDLRDEFTEAQVTTFTYDPLVGVTSITDPRGQVMYYEYDEFNRLKFVKNTEGEILKEHSYNYKN